MSNNATQNPQDQEIDLAVVSKKLNDFSQSAKNAFFNSILFVIKYKIIISALFILGVGLGIYLDSTNKSYESQVVVMPNFGTADYLYAKVGLINSKIKEGDTMFLKAIGIKEVSKFGKIEIKPIIDIYQFINNNSERNFELLKLMAEDNDMKKLIEERPTSKNYSYHLISYTTKNKTNKEKTLTPLLNFLNNSNFYSKIQNEELKNLGIRMKSNEIILAQIDNFLNGIASGKGTGDKLVYYNENSPLNDIIQTKERIVREQGNLRINRVSMDKIIKDVSQVINIENRESVNGKLKLILPLLFIFIFLAINAFFGFYKHQRAIRQQTA